MTASEPGLFRRASLSGRRGCKTPPGLASAAMPSLKKTRSCRCSAKAGSTREADGLLAPLRGANEKSASSPLLSRHARAMLQAEAPAARPQDISGINLHECRIRFMKTPFTMVLLLGGLLCFPGQSAAKAEDYALIIEKNLFSPTRKKYVTPPKKPRGKRITKAMMPKLLGTIISEDRKLAVFSVQKSRGRKVSRFRKTSAKRPWISKRRTKSKKQKRARRPRRPRRVRAPVIARRVTDTRIVGIGERFGDYRLIAIDDKQVTLEHAGQKIQLSTQR